MNDAWTENDHTMMKVLNKYDKIKAGGYGSFCITPVETIGDQPRRVSDLKPL